MKKGVWDIPSAMGEVEELTLRRNNVNATAGWDVLVGCCPFCL